MELALHHPPVRRQALQGAVRDRRAETEAGGGRGGGERAVRARVPGEKVAQGILDGLRERLGYADRQRCAERVSQPARVLDRRPVVGSRDTDPDGAAGGRQLRGPPRLGAPLRQFGVGERPEDAQQVGDALDVLDAAVVGAPLEFLLQLGEHVRVEELAQLGLAEQFGEQPRVQRQSGGAPLGERGVALVQELGDVAEQKGAGERGGLRGGHLDEADLAGLDVTHQLGEAGHVEDVLEALPHGFEDDGERTELARHLEELGGALALLPQGCACRGCGGAAAGRGPRTRGSGRRTGPIRRPGR